ncbi:MAG: hypothetical protein L6R37_005005 [Teloschistes peruensis]|nr:MAG: hypothetical protein L6R37_005005 [Teloschistes peruensis]
MASLATDTRYLDSYSECSSSNSSFSYGLLTPTSLTEFSAATSRRQSIVSEGQACNGVTYDKGPTFSGESIATPFGTPPPSYQSSCFDNSSQEIQCFESGSSRLRACPRRQFDAHPTLEGPHFPDLFCPQNPYLYPSAPAGPGVEIQKENSHEGGLEGGSISMSRPLMDWSAAFDSSFEQGYGQADWQRFNESFAFDPHPPTLLPAPSLVDFGMVDGASMEADLPQTVAPQETTFVMPNSSFGPATPLVQQLDMAFQTPAVKYEQRPRSWSEEAISPSSSVFDGDSPTERRYASTKGKELLDGLIQTPPQRAGGSGSRSVRKEMVETNTPKYSCDIKTIPSSSNKKHMCLDCNLPFERPEHCKRHKKSLQHKGLVHKPKTEYTDDQKPFSCDIPGCKVKLTRGDNYKPHLQKTHFFDRDEVRESKGKPRKRNRHVSIEEARRLGLGHMDQRTFEGQQPRKRSKIRRGGANKVADG